jgi:hypothetical protein
LFEKLLWICSKTRGYREETERERERERQDKAAKREKRTDLLQ